MGRQVTALSPWFVSNRMLGMKAGELMGKRKWIGIPFAGGMAELLHLKATTYLVSDIHRHVINLAHVVKTNREKLQTAVDLLAFHPDTLHESQARCMGREVAPPAIYRPELIDPADALGERRRQREEILWRRRGSRQTNVQSRKTFSHSIRLFRLPRPRLRIRSTWAWALPRPDIPRHRRQLQIRSVASSA